jgi:signal transduction histidine kinase
MELGPININHLLEDILFLNANYLKIHDIHKHMELSPDLPEIMGDGERLKQVFMNLISNAAEAMEPKGGGNLTVQTARKGSDVQITFADTGVGIPQENIPGLFDPFFTTKSRGKGIGLGLSVAYGIVQQHCGSIEVQSEEEAGTSLTITLPLKQPEGQYH